MHLRQHNMREAVLFTAKEQWRKYSRFFVRKEKKNGFRAGSARRFGQRAATMKKALFFEPKSLTVPNYTGPPFNMI